MLTTDITKYVALAFTKAGNLVKTLTISTETKGAFNPATGNYPRTVSTFQIEVIDDEEDTRILQANFSNRNIRSYIVKATTMAEVGQKFTDGGIEYTIYRISPIQQGNVDFVYTMWAEA